jgi:hypothetical protein
MAGNVPVPVLAHGYLLQITTSILETFGKRPLSPKKQNGLVENVY